MAQRGNSEQESWWVLRAQSGDREALNELLKVVQVPLHRYILSLVRKEPEAEDILQEVFVRIYRKLRWLREPQAFRAWTYQIATREAFRHLRKERRWGDRFRDETITTEERLPLSPNKLAPELVERLHCLVDELSPASRAVIVLYYLHEMSLEETSAVLAIPLGTVKSRLAYGLETLRKRLREERQVTRNA